MGVGVSVAVHLVSRFVLTIVDETISFSHLFLSESQSTEGSDRNIHTHACKYKSISSQLNIILFRQFHITR
jgi:hypothetical protein